MFAPNELERQLHVLLELPYISHDIINVSGHAAVGIGGETSIHRCYKEPFHSDLHFCVNAVRGMYNDESEAEYVLRTQYAATAHFASLYEVEFDEQMATLPFWAQMAPPRGKLLRATQLLYEWYDWALVAEFAREYIFVSYVNGD